MMLIIGNHVSPYVRKVLVALTLKGVDHRIDPIVPFFGDDRFGEISPLRRIPVMVDGDLTLCDSTVICEYLDDAYPDHPLKPANAADRARARWIEEFADSRLGDLIIWRLFFQKQVRPYVFRQPTDEALVAQTVDIDLPAALDYLEPLMPASGWLFEDRPGIAEISLASFFRNAEIAGWTPDAARWPSLVGLIARTAALPAFDALRPFEDAILRTRRAEQRTALAELGAPIAEESYGADTPRPGLMPI
jgi:glutathione S-transferase